MKTTIAIVISCCFLINIIACKKAPISDADNSTVSDNITAEGIAQEVQNLAEQAHSLGKSGTIGMRTADIWGMLSNCVTVRDDSSNTFNIPDTLRINFGSSPCLCHDGRYRQGLITVYYTGKFRQNGAVIQMYFSNYAVGPTATDLYQISNSSSKQITVNAVAANGYPTWTITSNFTIVKSNGGGTITYTENKTRTQTAGNGAYITSANKYDISGTSSGTAANGVSFSAQTVSGSDLIKDMSCSKFFTQGSLTVTPGSESAITVNFGDGTCNNTVTISRGSHSSTVNLR